MRASVYICTHMCNNHWADTMCVYQLQTDGSMRWHAGALTLVGSPGRVMLYFVIFA